MRRWKQAGFFFVIMLPVACDSVQDVADNHHARMHGPAVTETDDSSGIKAGTEQGHELVQRYCSQCHDAPSAKLHTAEEWPGVFVRMQGYMQAREKTVPLDDERVMIIEYLEVNARQD